MTWHCINFYIHEKLNLQYEIEGLNYTTRSGQIHSAPTIGKLLLDKYNSAHDT